MALMLEWQQDWSRKATAGGVLQIARDHGAAWDGRQLRRGNEGGQRSE
ncbi:hypothetical protein M5585_22415 [Serratia ureilytica]